MFAEINDSKIYFDIASSGLSIEDECTVERPALTILHGSYLDHTYLKSVFTSLGDEYQLLFLDYRGSGRSDRSNPEHWHVEQLAKDVVALLDMLGIKRTFLLGHSWGCHVATAINAIAEDRVMGNILLNPVVFRLTPYLKKVEKEGGDTALIPAKGFFADRDTDCFYQYAEKVVPLLFRNEAPASLSQTLPSPEFVTASLEEWFCIDLLAQIKQLQKPSLVMHGRYDLYALDNDHEQIWQALPNNCEVIECAQAGHFVFYDEPEVCDKSIRLFMQSNCPVLAV